VTTKSWRKNLLQIMLKNCAATRKLSGQNKVQQKLEKLVASLAQKEMANIYSQFSGSCRRFSRRPTKTGWLKTCVGFIGSFGSVENIWLKIVQIKLTTWRLFDICVQGNCSSFF